MAYDCDRFSEALVDVVEASATDSRYREVFQHLEACEACAAELQALRATWASLPQPADTVRPSRAVRESVLAHAAKPRTVPEQGPTGVPSTRRRALSAAALILLVSVSALTGIRMTREEPVSSTLPTELENKRFVGADIGAEAPAFAALDVISGEVVDLADRRGDVVLVNIWATWCGPCESEMPSMERLYQRLGPQGLSIVAVSIDQESTYKVRRWIEDRGITFTVLHDRDGSIEETFQTRGVPETFVIDRQGVVVQRVTGPRLWDAPDAEAFLADLLREGA